MIYKVLSDRLAGREKGSTVEADELHGVNIDALIKGGHLAEQKTKAAKAEKEEG
jgi:hypothetical protein